LNDYKARVHLELHRDPSTIDDAVYEILTYMETMKNPNQPDDNKKSVRQIKNTPKDLIHGQLNGKKPVETRETEMYNAVVTGGSGEQSKTIMIKEEDLQALFQKMMGQTKQEVPTKTFQRPNAIQVFLFYHNSFTLFTRATCDYCIIHFSLSGFNWFLAI
jgi:hypothetical protein